MNLISDYREQQESDHEDEREDPFAEPEYEEKPTISPNAGAGGLPEFPQHRRRSRSPWWLILALLLLISAAIYWGFCGIRMIYLLFLPKSLRLFRSRIG
jgi:hypothetical protein